MAKCIEHFPYSRHFSKHLTFVISFEIHKILNGIENILYFFPELFFLNINSVFTTPLNKHVQSGFSCLQDKGKIPKLIFRDFSDLALLYLTSLCLFTFYIQCYSHIRCAAIFCTCHSIFYTCSLGRLAFQLKITFPELNFHVVVQMPFYSSNQFGNTKMSKSSSLHLKVLHLQG